jgi:hypothetical protein
MLEAVLSLQPRAALGAARPDAGAAGNPPGPADADQQPGTEGQGAGCYQHRQQQQGEAAATAAGDDEALAARADEMRAALPPPLRREAASALRDPFAPLPNGAVNSLGVVLGHEIQR